MDDLEGPPIRLLYALATGQASDQDAALLEAMMRAGGREDCPPWVQARASRLAQQSPALLTRGTEPFSAVVRRARLIFDSWSIAQPTTMRGPGAVGRQVLLRAGEVEISIHVRPDTSAGLMLLGQVLAPTGGTGEAVLVDVGDEAVEPPTATREPAHGPVTLDAFGEFAFADVSPGRYVLSLQLPTERIESVALDIQGEPDDLALPRLP